jgi:FAD synthase
VRATLHGRIRGPGAVVVGSWDPFVRAHQRLIEQLASHARQTALASVVVLIDPPPPLFVWGRHDWPIYDEVWTRMELVRRCGVDAILLVHFTRADVDAGAAEFFALLDAHLTVAELWLGTYQTLGSVPRGATAAIDELAGERGIHLVRLPPLRLETEDVRRLLAAGRVREASRVVGRVPVRRRPRSLTVRLAWQPGVYSVVPLARPMAAAEGRPFAVELATQSQGLPALHWPERTIRYLAFVAGPGDGVTKRR